MADKTAKRRGRPPIGTPHPTDVHVGSRIRQRRTLLGMSQEKLGKGLGLTFQQIQKYERGANRVGASRLFEMSKLLDVPVNYFFDDMPEEGRGGLKENQSGYEADQMNKRETLELVRAYYKIREPSVRRRVYDLCKAIARADDALDD
ncbi:MAG: hypothetical protein Alpg2KO_22870 [Alphaproteobacteria bacterium]